MNENIHIHNTPQTPECVNINTQLTRAHLIDVLVSAVVPGAGQALGVFVVQTASHHLQYSGGGEVFRGDHLQSPSLPVLTTQTILYWMLNISRSPVFTIKSSLATKLVSHFRVGLG